MEKVQVESKYLKTGQMYKERKSPRWPDRLLQR